MIWMHFQSMGTNQRPLGGKSRSRIATLRIQHVQIHQFTTKQEIEMGSVLILQLNKLWHLQANRAVGNQVS